MPLLETTSIPNNLPESQFTLSYIIVPDAFIRKKL